MKFFITNHLKFESKLLFNKKLKKSNISSNLKYMYTS